MVGYHVLQVLLRDSKSMGKRSEGWGERGGRRERGKVGEREGGRKNMGEGGRGVERERGRRERGEEGEGEGGGEGGGKEEQGGRRERGGERGGRRAERERERERKRQDRRGEKIWTCYILTFWSITINGIKILYPLVPSAKLIQDCRTFPFINEMPISSKVWYAQDSIINHGALTKLFWQQLQALFCQSYMYRVTYRFMFAIRVLGYA